MTLKDLESQLLALTPAEKERVIQLLTHSLTIDSPFSAGRGSANAQRSAGEEMLPQPAEVAKSVEISAGEARIGNTQIAIWELVNAQDLGCSDRDLLQMYPQLTENDLVTAWDYADAHPEEIMLALQAIDE